MQEGDSILLSTDGFWGPLDARNIAGRLRGEAILTLVPKLMAEAERKAGAESDNLSVVGLTWEKQDAEADASPTITITEPLQGFTTSAMNTTQPIAAFKENVTEEDIERAIREIQDAIKKSS